MSDVLPQSGDKREEGVSAPPQQQRRGLRMLGVVLIALALLLGVYLLVGYLGWQSGQDLLEQKQELQLGEQVERQLALAAENLAEGSVNLAARRLEWVLTRVPNQQEAMTLLQTAEAMPGVAIAPAPAAVPATPTATPLPSPTPGLISDPLQELQRLRLLVAKQEWATAVAAITAFQRQFPDYERRETDRLLFDSYIDLGRELLEGEQAELGMFYLNQAETLGDLPQEVLDYRVWAEWYLQGIAFYGVNWEVTIGYFRDLCLVAPFYQSSCDLLAEALINYADQYAFAQDWCPAQELYLEARRHQGNSSELGQKVTDAAEGCLTATATPAVITGTNPLSGVLPSGVPLFPLATATPEIDDPSR